VAKSNVAVQNLAGATLAPENLPGLSLPNWFAPAGGAGSYPAIFADDWGPFSSNAVAVSMTERAISLGAISLAANSTHNQNGITGNGAGAFTINLKSLNLASVVLDQPLSLSLIGQTSTAAQMAVENLAPVMIIIRSSTTVAVTFHDNNSRPLIMAFSSNNAAAPTLLFQNGTDYRLHLIADHQPLTLSSTSTTTLRGGISTDDDLTIESGTIHLRAETARPEWFDQLLWRSFWVETYQQF
jgi:hypothetical protein